ncbi:hypothetical protein OPT61_g3653 [Boeremia exigua]|uniref:Uncharacterized protein n=1 Tax=Boeremia exigua TaxID=749465 RepID=A0ACC2IH48_9PLEO|nr:hypothetical protein OPT61_g3653 [Boeremia exigua]
MTSFSTSDGLKPAEAHLTLWAATTTQLTRQALIDLVHRDKHSPSTALGELIPLSSQEGSKEQHGSSFGGRHRPSTASRRRHPSMPHTNSTSATPTLLLVAQHTCTAAYPEHQST